MMRNLIVQNKILPEIRLPFDTVKGSVLKRQKMAQNYTEKLYNSLNPLCKDGTCEVGQFKTSLDKVIAPSKINYFIAPELNESYNGSMGTISKLRINEDNNFVITHLAYKFMLPLDDNCDYILSKFTALHEARHFFDRLFNPKYNINRLSSGVNNPEYRDSIETIHQLFLGDIAKPVKMQELKQKVSSLAAGMPNSVKIDTFQSIKYRLQSEINAYKDELKFFSKEKWSLANINSMLKFLVFLKENCKFEAKLKFVKQIIKDSINNERLKLKIYSASRI